MSLFPDLPPLAKAKAKAFEKALVSWVKLDHHIRVYKPTANDLKHLIQMEHSGNDRVAILKRLIGKLSSANRGALYLKLKIPNE